MGNAHPSSRAAAHRGRKNVHWKSAEVPLPPGKPTATLGEGPEGREGRLRWAPPRHDGGAPLLGYMVECNRLGSPAWVRTNPPLVLGPELILAGLELGHRYRFRVSAQNIVGASLPGEVSEVLTVGDEFMGPDAPVFHELLHDADSIENEKTEFRVYFDGRPTPAVAWFKDGFEIFSSRRTAIVTDNNSSTLIFHQTSLGDEGEIKCTITNRAGHAVSRARLRLQAAPRVRLPRRYEDGLLFDAGEQLQLKVAVAGKPTPHIQWRHDGRDLSSDDRIQITSGDKFTSLRIAFSSRSDRGEYQVSAANEIGDDSASFLVTITARPDPPRYLTATRGVGERSALLAWEPPDDDGGCQISSYIVEYYRTGWNVWLKAATERKTNMVLADLIEGSEYRFRIKAESPYGVSEPSEESTSVIIPGRRLDLPPLDMPVPEAAPRRRRQPSPRDDDSYCGESIESGPPKKHRNTNDKENDRKGDNMKMGSSEFMLILYPDEQKTAEDKRKSFQLDLEDAMTPPALSLSAPQLGANLCLMPPLRYSVSSTELLHEQAMSRMYQVMALKEAESAKANKFVKSKPASAVQEPPKEVPVEIDPNEIIEKWRVNGDLTEENEKSEKDESIQEDDTQDRSEENDLFEDDYTTSTVSTGDSEYSDSDSLEEGRRRRNDFDETNTYHPKEMIPKGIPEEDRQDVKIKPIPLPDPNFIPKPILKKREPVEAPLPSVKEDAKPKPLFSKVPLLKRITKSQDDKKEKVTKEVKKLEVIKPVVSSSKAPLIKEPKLEPLFDERSIVAERYGNLVKELGSSKRQQPILYTNTDDLKRVGEMQEQQATPKKPSTPKKITKPEIQKPVKQPLQKPLRQEPQKTTKLARPEPQKPIKPEPQKPIKPEPQKLTKPEPAQSAVKSTNHTVQTVTLPKSFDEINAEAESNVKGAFSYVINASMVVVAAWLYVFKSELLAIPFLALAIYREMHAALKNRMPRWLTRK